MALAFRPRKFKMGLQDNFIPGPAVVRISQSPTPHRACHGGPTDGLPSVQASTAASRMGLRLERRVSWRAIRSRCQAAVALVGQTWIMVDDLDVRIKDFALDHADIRVHLTKLSAYAIAIRKPKQVAFSERLMRTM